MMKKWAQRDFCEATFYFYLFLFSTSVYVMATPVYWRSTGFFSSVHFWYTGLLHTYNSILRGMNICGYDSITCLTAVRIPLLPSDKIIPWLSRIPFFDIFLEVLGYEFLQQTTVVNSWRVLLLIDWIHCVDYTGHWYFLYVSICDRHSCGIAHIFTWIFVFIVNC